ncbi:type III-B CRISPR module RAMP protein Cmr1 [candidate division WS5 bacterium]|uniref:Type III-B CRISPR module RAMP protein Cmr1 n=1 Tax=candidate division WS5 bacterium TaxID=2093353 RepID=A0A419DDR2_9BACT|nr:MAG: type III-B CRISPR module RAMP protein Cmr1 [candidate division WS5 bacterium]
MDEKMEFRLKTLTPIWTGNVDMKCDRLHETGIIGSIRWWYEALVRGLGGYACDPTSKIKEERCEFDTKSYQKNENLEVELKKICPACQMFGCTGWGKKIRWVIDDSSMSKNINTGRTGEFSLFGIEIKALSDEEKWLVYSVFSIINTYGTIGGKCMLKPSPNHYCDDRGKVIVTQYGFEKPTINIDQIKRSFSEQKRIIESTGQKISEEWPNLTRFFFSPEESLDAGQFMGLVGLDTYSNFLKGHKGDRRDPEARANKFASFKNIGLTDPKQKKFWGYTKDEDEMYDAVKNTLTDDLVLKKIKTGKEVLDEL